MASVEGRPEGRGERKSVDGGRRSSCRVRGQTSVVTEGSVTSSVSLGVEEGRARESSVSVR